MNFLDHQPWTDWLPTIQRPLIISGPCSAETAVQVMETARHLKTMGKCNILRAGIWKPRTRPNSFEGVGEEALTWLKDAGNETGLYTATEVANASHVEACLKVGIDILWIGARTTVNPFSVQEIADSLKGVDIPVIVKNPINPDLQLWIGALERINQAGITKLMAIHRGFSSFSKTKYRNIPMWEIPIELKTVFPGLPLICDPSHIAGQRGLLLDVSQKALDLEYDGLMIETHLDPDNAWSDSQQQITPQALDQLLSDLIIRKKMEEVANNQLTELRHIIDELDENIIEQLGNRMDLATKIGEFKRDWDITILQVKRWEEILRTRTQLGVDAGLPSDFIKKLVQLIHRESIQRQTDVMNKKSNTPASQDE